jgi:hypothetical protein
MKKTVWFLILLPGLFLFPKSSQAQLSLPGSSPLNPIYIKVQPDYAQLNNYYLDLYGSDYASCHLQCLKRGIDSPYVQQECIDYAVSCAKSLKQKALFAPTLSPDQVCQKNYGTYSKYSGYMIPGQVCSQKYGEYSKYSGNLNENEIIFVIAYLHAIMASGFVKRMICKAVCHIL